jgi:hypothetical protein
MAIDWLDTAVLVAIVIALVNAIKTASGNKWGYWYMLIAIAFGFGVYAISIYAPDFVKMGLAIGLASSGIYDIYSKK